jgi:hypothetical protein
VTFRSTIEPHRHAGLETGLSTLRIESQAQTQASGLAKDFEKQSILNTPPRSKSFVSQQM